MTFAIVFTLASERVDSILVHGIHRCRSEANEHLAEADSTDSAVVVHADEACPVVSAGEHTPNGDSWCWKGLTKMPGCSFAKLQEGDGYDRK
jgi:hypothetical protein